VPIGEEVVRELLLFSIGVVPSVCFIRSICKVFRARVWRVLDVVQGKAF
jgi:hypothetical protein